MRQDLYPVNAVTPINSVVIFYDDSEITLDILQALVQLRNTMSEYNRYEIILKQ